MQFTTGSLVFLGLAAFSTFANAQQVAYGQQLQNNDQTNHWVTWKEHEHACPGMQVLDVLTKDPCAQPFNLGEVRYTLTGCSGDSGHPTAILDASGLQIGGCSANDNDKINCHGDLHDIIKHGVCTIVSGKRAMKREFE